MAMDILAIQASLVPCKCVFSSAKETIVPCQYHLKPVIMEATQMIKYALRSSTNSTLNFTAHLSVDSVMKEMDEADKLIINLPSDIEEYCKEYRPVTTENS